MRISERFVLGALFAVLAGTTTVLAGVPYPHEHESRGIDLGSMRVLESTRPLTATSRSLRSSRPIQARCAGATAGRRG